MVSGRDSDLVCQRARNCLRGHDNTTSGCPNLARYQAIVFSIQLIKKVVRNVAVRCDLKQLEVQLKAERKMLYQCAVGREDQVATIAQTRNRIAVLPPSAKLGNFQGNFHGTVDGSVVNGGFISVYYGFEAHYCCTTSRQLQRVACTCLSAGPYLVSPSL